MPALEHAALLPDKEGPGKDGNVVHQYGVGTVVAEEYLVVSLQTDKPQLAVQSLAGEGEHAGVRLSGHIAYEILEDVPVHFEELRYLAEYLQVFLRYTGSSLRAGSGIAEFHQTQQHQSLVLAGYLVLDIAADTFYDGVLVQLRRYVVEVPQVGVQRQVVVQHPDAEVLGQVVGQHLEGPALVGPVHCAEKGEEVKESG